MIDTVKIIEAFSGLIGWRQNVDSQGEQLAASLVSSTSTLFYNDVHPMVTLDNILSILKEEEDVSTWIQNKTNAFILQGFNDWYYKKSYLRTGNGVLTSSVLFANAGDPDDPSDHVLINEGEKIGLRIHTGQSLNTKHVVHAVAIQMESNTPITLVVWDVKRNEEIFREVIDYMGDGTQTWYDVEFAMKGGGEYRIEYVAPSTINSPISGMRGAEMPHTKLYKVEGIRDGETVNENFGIDIKMSVSCDYTDLIVEQKDVFIDMIGKRVAMGMLRELVYNPDARHNRHEKNFDDQQLLYEIDGDSQGKKDNNNGLASQYEKALRSVQFDRSNIDKICLPCQRRGLRYTTTG